MIYFPFDKLETLEGDYIQLIVSKLAEAETRREENEQLRRLIHRLAEENRKLVEENERLKRIIRIFVGEE